jgi:hypothetical protein
MLAAARMTGMAAGATLTALFFRVAPQGAETLGLMVGAAFAVAAAFASISRLGKA